MDRLSAILAVVFMISFMGAILVWAFWTAPWVKRLGRDTPSLWDWAFVQIQFFNDLQRAVEFAAKRGHYPWQLWLQIVLVAIPLTILVFGLLVVLTE